jgi:NAD(P)-dependent dehydrogenase (short-subunit alcohol dehydrogenase family)
LAEASRLALRTQDSLRDGRSIETTDLPGAIARIRCDHLRDDERAAAFASVAAQAGGLDVLVNSA